MHSTGIKQDIYRLSFDRKCTGHQIWSVPGLLPTQNIDFASHVLWWLVRGSCLILLGFPGWIAWVVSYLSTLILVILLRLLSPRALSGRRWWMQAVLHLMLRTPIVVASFVGATLPRIVPRLFASIAHHSRPVLGLLALIHVVVIAVVPGRPLVLVLKVKIFSLVPLLLIPPKAPCSILFSPSLPFPCSLRCHIGHRSKCTEARTSSL